MHCKGICLKYLAKKPESKKSGHYELGHKRCSICEVYLIWDGRNCPCCGTALRKKPRNSKARTRIIENIKVKNSQK